MKKPKVYIVILNYKSVIDTAEYLESNINIVFKISNNV